MFNRLHSLGFAFAILVSLSCAVAAADKPPPKPTKDPATWKPEIRSQHDAIRALTATPKEPIGAAVMRLAAQGSDARAAIFSLANDSKLPEPHRAYAGIMSAYFVQFDLAGLRAMAESKTNPFGSRQAIDFLADIGGPGIKTFLQDLGKKDASLTAYVDKALGRLPANELIFEGDRKLLSDILLESAEAKRLASVIIVDRYQGKPNMDRWLESVLASRVADTEAQMHASVALSRIHANDVAKLKALTARNKHRFLRYNAIQQLALKGPPGEAVLRELLAAPDEPLKPHIEKRLAKK